MVYVFLSGVALNGLAIIGWFIALLSFADSLFGHIVICKKTEK